MIQIFINHKIQLSDVLHQLCPQSLFRSNLSYFFSIWSLFSSPYSRGGWCRCQKTVTAEVELRHNLSQLLLFKFPHIHWISYTINIFHFKYCFKILSCCSSSFLISIGYPIQSISFTLNITSKVPVVALQVYLYPPNIQCNQYLSL